MTEFGGIAFAGSGGWGYADGAVDEDAFMTRLEGLVSALSRSRVLQGWCYTQLTDVFQERNGLLGMDRKPKVGIERLRAAITRAREGS